MVDSRIRRLADVLVHYSVAVKKGQLVILASPPAGLPLLIELYRAVLEARANPVIRCAPEEAAELMARHASKEQLSFIDPMRKLEVESTDAYIHVWAEQNTRHLSQADPKRLAIRSAAQRPVKDIFLKRAAAGKLRWVGTQYPTQASAQDAEMSLSEYADFVLNAGKLDQADPVKAWKAQSVMQQRLTDYLNGKRELRVTAANGTDLRMSIVDRRWINCDGHENFPDGEVFTGPVVESVEGTVRFSFPAVHAGREVDGVMLKFRGGQVVEASAAKGEAFLHSMLKMDPGASYLGECAIGTNYGIQRYTRNTLFDEKIGGTVHFALGAGYPETGNTNQSGLHWDMVVDLRQGGRVEIDGKPISVDGKFTRAGWPR